MSAPFLSDSSAPAYRAPALSYNGVVAAPHYLAAIAGINALRDGGNAIDAAIAANLVVTIVWPHMCGPGGDLFAQVWSARDNALFALNATGRAGSGMSMDAYRARGMQKMPHRGPATITVPGAVDGWFTLHERWGKLEPARLFRDAIRHAREGFAISQQLSAAITEAAPLLREDQGAAATFLGAGQHPATGTRLVQEDLAHTYEILARDGRAAFYRGALGEQVLNGARAKGSLLTAEDFAAHQSDWVTPLQTAYRGATISQLPPNSQGITLLEWLNMLADVDVASLGFGTAEMLHQVVERKKLAFADRDHYVTDPRQVHVPVERLLDLAYARARSAHVGERAAASVSAGLPGSGDTMYLCAADGEGNMVSLIQSLFAGFGSGVHIAGTGITLHNRGASFHLDPEHANALRPGKRPMHTLMPGFALRNGRPWMTFGTRGADGQPQTGLQVVTNVVDFQMQPQQAVEAPRWVHAAPSGDFPPDALVLEGRFGESVADELRARGHQVVLTHGLDFVMGSVQLIQRDDERGCLLGASDPRGDGAALPA